MPLQMPMNGGCSGTLRNAFVTTALKVTILSTAIAVALFLAWWGAHVVNIVNADYKDSKDSTYIIAGGMILIFAVMVAIATLVSGLPQHMSRSELLLSVPLGVALLAGALAYLYYGPPSNSVPAHHRDVTPGVIPTRSLGGPGPTPLATVTAGTPLPAR